uniref:(northern house mosquito) hypothetical protein n=1 Tax=Culex pipiens TaxID=7175 RepID=A0A8D8NQ60_CULPI
MNLHTIKGSRMHSFAWIPSEARASIGEGGWNTAFGAWAAVGTPLQNPKRAKDAHFEDFSFIRSRSIPGDQQLEHWLVKVHTLNCKAVYDRTSLLFTFTIGRSKKRRR